MSRYTGPKCRLCRREKVKLFLKGDRCFSANCPIEKKGAVPPGQHGLKSSRRQSDYGKQLREKQKTKRIYGLTESHLKNYFKKAIKVRQTTGEFLLQMLESRLDNVVYRMGFACTRAEARQLVSHKSIHVNASLINVPSYQVSPGDIITIREKAKKQQRIVDALSVTEQYGFPSWVEVNSKEMIGTFSSLPDRVDLGSDINEQLVVELYSK